MSNTAYDAANEQIRYNRMVMLVQLITSQFDKRRSPMSAPWKTWGIAQSDLGLEIVAPFEVSVTSAKKLRAEFLVKSFGARNGMLVFTNYDVVEPYREQLISLGYGFSVLEKPRKDEVYDRQEFVDLLSDWGWSGHEATKPSWVVS